MIAALKFNKDKTNYLLYITLKMQRLFVASTVCHIINIKFKQHNIKIYLLYDVKVSDLDIVVAVFVVSIV